MSDAVQAPDAELEEQHAKVLSKLGKMMIEAHTEDVRCLMRRFFENSSGRHSGEVQTSARNMVNGIRGSRESLRIGLAILQEEFK